MKFRAKSPFTPDALAVVVFVVFCSALTLAQQTTYTFIGRIFDSDFFQTACPPNCLVAGSFTVAQPLAANLSGLGSFPTVAFQFSDGVTTFTQPTDDWGFAADTNSFAGITNFDWYADLNGGDMSAYFDGPSNVTDDDTNQLTYQAYYFGNNQNNGGRWTRKYEQFDSPWGPTQYDNDVGKTMAQKGAATTALAMAADIANGGAGAFVDPGTLNTLMETDLGYDSNHNVLWRQVAQGLNFEWIGVNVSTPADLAASLQTSDQAIVLAVPSISGCIVQGNSPMGHYVLATSETSDGQGGYIIGINDPGCASHTTLDAYPVFQSRGYFLNPQNTQSGQQSAPAADESTLTFSGSSSIEIAVLDSNGRRTGFSHQGDKFEIPESYYYRDSITDADTGQDPTPVSHYLGFNSPPAATYTLLVTGLTSGDFSVNVYGYATDGSSETPVKVTGTVNAGQTIAYSVTYSPQPGSVPLIGPKTLQSLQ